MSKTKITIVVLLAVVCFGVYYCYKNILYKEARDITTEKSILTITADHLEKEYDKDPVQADAKYLNKTIEIEGRISEVTDSTMTLDNKVFCKMNEKAKKPLTNEKIRIKGRCIGFDDLFAVVKFDQCSIQHH